MKNNLNEWLYPFAASRPTIFLNGMADLCIDSRLLKKGDVFIALKGKGTDFHRHIEEAVQKEASLIVVDAENSFVESLRVPVVSVSHLAQRLGAMAARFYGNPSVHLKVIATTGTSGKTSITELLAQALQLCGKPCGTVGTLGIRFDDLHHDSGLTTPDAVTIQKYLATFLKKGAQYVAMEASSHALDQGRMNGLRVQSAIFSNLTQDHLDYHPTLEHYASTKARLFQWPELKVAILNADDPYSTLLARVSTAEHLMRYGIHKGDVCTTSISEGPKGLEAEVKTPNGSFSLKTELLGRHNLLNLLSVVTYLIHEGVSLGQIERIMPQLHTIPGRLERCHTPEEGPFVFVDFAHKPDAVEKVVQTLNHLKQGRLWCIVGCGGNRDALKRPLMAKAACGADVVILTSDNPRQEDPLAIIQAMEPGLDNRVESHILVSRQEAIEYALNQANPNDIILIAGKGNEEYQIVGDQKIPFQDKKIVESFFDRRRGK